MKSKTVWILSLVIMILLAVPLLLALKDNKQIFLPGETTHGHYQIELACNSCHSEAFGGKEVLQEACMNCHREDLALGDDSHPKSKFTDPRNSSRIKKLDARYCMSCHSEHQPEITRTMAVTLADDFCFSCHADIAEERSSHQGMAFNTCASAGCHNFHDNTALYEDFLLKHANESALLQEARVASRDLRSSLSLKAGISYQPLRTQELDAPPGHSMPVTERQQWLQTSHARAGINCMACHAVTKEGAQAQWLEKPDEQICRQCHELESDGYLAGKHGMRKAAGLEAMTPATARLPMESDAHDRQLGCSSCHGAHEFNTQRAAAEACVVCHADEHSKAYAGSAHARLWQAEQNGTAAPGSGVNCATCHLPRMTHKEQGRERILVQHNQNQNLRPNEKMIRQVCMNCHGLGFSIDALADSALVERNFNGMPSRHIESIDMAVKRVNK